MQSDLYAGAVESVSSAESVWHVKVLLLLNMSHMGCLLCGRVCSEQC